MVKKTASRPGSKARLASKSNGKPSGSCKQSKASGTAASNQTPSQDTAHQQLLLNVFQTTFNSVLSSENFARLLQEVKTALFNRNFDKAFGQEDYLEAYAARWSPTRTLCYSAVLGSIAPYVDGLFQRQEELRDAKACGHAGAVALRILAIGGAAAELVAIGSYLSQQSRSVPGSIVLLDVAPWAGVVEKLQTNLTTPPTLSQYASAAAQAANAALVGPDQLKDVIFKQHDVLTLSRDDLASLISPDASQQPCLVTLFFTLNELFTAGGIGKTTTFLLTLTSVLPPGSLLLVIDSPGSYSETTVGKEAKRYPMQWLLDKILLQAEDGRDALWDKVEEKESVWFRLGQELRYPIPLEDMRYQMHLFCRSGGS